METSVVLLSSLLLLMLFQVKYPVPVGSKATAVLDSTRSRGENLSILLISTWLSGHQMHLLAVGEELVLRGHRVSFLTTEVSGSNIIPHVPIKLGMKFISAGPDPRTKGEYENKVYNLMGQSVLGQRLSIMPMMQEHLFKLRLAIDRLNGPDWDLVLADYTHSMNLVRYLTAKWGVKVVLSASSIIDYSSMAPWWPHPSMYIRGASDNMSFYHRALSTLFYQLFFANTIGTVLTKLYLAGNDTELWNSVYYDDPYFSYSPDLLYPMLYFSAFGLEYAHLHHPNVHLVGPVLSKSIVPIQDELKQWLDGKQAGEVVYISMGTTAILSREMASALLDGVKAAGYSAVWSLRKSNQNVIEGLEIDKTLFYISKWVPQIAVLQHPAIRMAILHCGSGGLHEAMYNKVPVICIPFCFDQFSWANKIRDQGVGITMYAEDITFDAVLRSIKNIDTGGYKDRVVKMSKILKQAGGSRRAAELLEYYSEVGYDHLIPAYVKYRWSWVQYYNLDAYLCLGIGLALGGFLCGKLLKFFLRCCV